MREKLNHINELVMKGDLKTADKLIDNLYEDYSSSRIWLSKEESDYMFHLIDVVSQKLYG